MKMALIPILAVASLLLGCESTLIKAFLYRAADLGADGVIFYRGSLAAGTEGGGWLGGGFGRAVKPSQDAVYRGEAIHLK